jgi:nucleoside-diphosphate-sugar epimerase
MHQTGDAVLVTGGSGFIGSWVLRELLRRGARPVVFDLQPAPERWRRVLGAAASQVAFEAGSLVDRARLESACAAHGVTRIIHLAALLTPACQQDPWIGFQVNVAGSVAIFELARAMTPRLAGISYASSFAVYGPETDDAPETGGAAQNRPSTFYGAFKQSFDLIAEQYWRHFQIASVGIRPHVVFGPERESGLTAGPSLAARAAALGERYTIGYRGRVGYDYVEDVARAFVRSAYETPAGHNVVDLPGEIATSEDFLHAIEALEPAASSRLSVAGPEIPSNIPPRRQDITNLFADWRATSLIEGVRKTIDYYRTAAA